MDPKEYKKLWHSVGCELEHPAIEQLDPSIWSEENRFFVSEYGVPIGPVFFRYVEFSGSSEFDYNRTEKKVYLTHSALKNIFFNYGCSEIANHAEDCDESEIIACNISKFMAAQVQFNITERSLVQEIESLTEQEIDSKIIALKEMILHEIGFESKYWDYLIFCIHHEFSNYPRPSMVPPDLNGDISEYDEFNDYEYETEDP
jgi:hypothetical protein